MPGVRVLHVDDDALTLSHTATRFRELFVRCDSAATIDDAIDRLVAVRFDAIILDMYVPWRGHSEKAGYEFLQELRKGTFEQPGGTSKDVAVVVFSACHPAWPEMVAASKLATKTLWRLVPFEELFNTVLLSAFPES
jgi:CheY-like chemotaxis protein